MSLSKYLLLFVRASRSQESRRNDAAAARLYTQVQREFTTLLEVLDENGNNPARAGQCLGAVGAISISIAAQSVNPSEPASNWHRAFKPHYLGWLRDQAGTDGTETLAECDDAGHQIVFVNELRSHVQAKVRSAIPANVRRSRHEFDGQGEHEESEEFYPLWALRATRNACATIEDELLVVAKYHFTTHAWRFNRGQTNRLEEAFRKTIDEHKADLDYPPFVSTPRHPRSYVHWYGYPGDAELADEDRADDGEGEEGEVAENADAISETGGSSSSPAEEDEMIEDEDANLSSAREYSPNPLEDSGRTSTVDEGLYLEPATLEESGAINGNECPICSEEFKASEQEAGEIVKAIVCAHIFHRECLTEWVNAHSKSICPYCREVLFEEEEEEEDVMEIDLDEVTTSASESGSEFEPFSDDSD